MNEYQIIREATINDVSDILKIEKQVFTNDNWSLEMLKSELNNKSDRKTLIIVKADKVIACICSGVQLLISAKIVKGKKIAGYYSLEDDITNAGAIYTDKPAVIDSKIITTAHYKDMGPWMKATLSFFSEK